MLHFPHICFLLYLANKSYFLNCMILCQVADVAIACISRFYKCRLLGKVKFLNCKWSSYNCTQKKRKKEPRWNFFLLFKFILCTILGERNQFDFYTFCILCSNAVLYSYHDTRFRILSKTCEHIFMLIALYTLYFVVKLLEQKCLTS